MPQNSGTHRPIAVQDSALTLHGEPTAMYGGAVHYWRLERERWAPILDSVRAMGFTMISIYIPWEVHEISKGRFDFGEIKFAVFKGAPGEFTSFGQPHAGLPG